MTMNDIENLVEDAKINNYSKIVLAYKELTSLPPNIIELKNITHLNLTGNKLKSLPSELFELVNITSLNLAENELEFLPPEISNLVNITSLNLTRNRLEYLPSEISKLNNLTELYIFNNNLADLPPEISRLRRLTRLYLTGNKLVSLPSKISNLRNLIDLDLSNNQLTTLPHGISKLESLERLDLRNNKLTILPREILDLELDINWEPVVAKGIFIGGNPFENPPVEIIKQGRKAIFNYFKSQEGENKQLNEVKVLLVGDGGAGKTSLVKRLLGEDFDGNEHQTQGINIKGWKFKDTDTEIKVNFWDFGGQEIMHATHQFFLSKRSLYILVLDGRKDEKAEYWLKHIENFGGDSPVLVVINKIDENPGFDQNRKFLRDKYPSIRGFYRLSCKSEEGIDAFSKNLMEELAKVRHTKEIWAKSWFNVKSRLEEMHPNSSHVVVNEDMCKHCNFIQYKDYKLMCDEEGIKDESEQNTLVDFLHDLGVILHFKDISLLNTYVLDPEWVTNAVYKIINSKEIASFEGILKHNMFAEILKEDNFPLGQYGFILSLMKKFELSYDLDDSTVLLPGLLKIQEPDFEFDYRRALKFIIDYDFLPPSIMPRFIVKMHRDIKDDLCWRTGVVLEDENLNSSAVVRADNEAKKINIYVNGEQRRDYFAVILQNFREINDSFEKLRATEKIPLPDRPEVTVSYKHLIKLEMRGTEMYMPDGSDYEYRVSDLLGTVINRSNERLLLEEIFRNTEISKNREKEILEIILNLQKIDIGSDDEDTLIEKMSSAVSVSFPPSVGLDIGKIVKLYHSWKNSGLKNS